MYLLHSKLAAIPIGYRVNVWPADRNFAKVSLDRTIDHCFTLVSLCYHMIAGIRERDPTKTRSPKKSQRYSTQRVTLLAEYTLKEQLRQEPPHVMKFQERGSKMKQHTHTHTHRGTHDDPVSDSERQHEHRIREVASLRDSVVPWSRGKGP